MCYSCVRKYKMQYAYIYIYTHTFVVDVIIGVFRMEVSRWGGSLYIFFCYDCYLILIIYWFYMVSVTRCPWTPLEIHMHWMYNESAFFRTERAH